MTYIVAWLATAFVFFAVDLAWLGWVARRFYRARIGHLMAERPNWTAAGLFYAAYIVGIVLFAVAPALAQGSVGPALLWGALFGFFAYGTYDMTNLATLRGWPLSMALADIAWGTLLTAGSAAAGYAITRAVMPG